MRAVKIVAIDATRVEAACGSRSGWGTSSLVVREAPVGPCQVRVELADRSLSTEIAVTEPAVFRCDVSEESLTCS